MSDGSDTRVLTAQLQMLQATVTELQSTVRDFSDIVSKFAVFENNHAHTVEAQNRAWAEIDALKKQLSTLETIVAVERRANSGTAVWVERGLLALVGGLAFFIANLVGGLAVFIAKKVGLN